MKIVLNRDVEDVRAILNSLAEYNRRSSPYNQMPHKLYLSHKKEYRLTNLISLWGVVYIKRIGSYVYTFSIEGNQQTTTVQGKISMKILSNPAVVIPLMFIAVTYQQRNETILLLPGAIFILAVIISQFRHYYTFKKNVEAFLNEL